MRRFFTSSLFAFALFVIELIADKIAATNASLFALSLLTIDVLLVLSLLMIEVLLVLSLSMIDVLLVLSLFTIAVWAVVIALVRVVLLVLSLFLCIVFLNDEKIVAVEIAAFRNMADAFE